ncbi:MAG: hypothetical protein WCA85_17375 [Paraburkholderia sp.]|uniref:hypothetical protein n=1 Tax=Paraburkholderia sp. TaxID=1926495 RepID=UPI003C58A734
MTNPRGLPDLTLHVFEQDGGWHWGLTIARPHGTGKKVVAYSKETFSSETQARADGQRTAYAFEHDDNLRQAALA